ncbi:unnamed protein product, partial [marine sediment metagenome]
PEKVSPELLFILPAPSVGRGHIQLLRTEEMTLSDWSLENIALAAAPTTSIGR